MFLGHPAESAERAHPPTVGDTVAAARRLHEPPEAEADTVLPDAAAPLPSAVAMAEESAEIRKAGRAHLLSALEGMVVALVAPAQEQGEEAPHQTVAHLAAAALLLRAMVEEARVVEVRLQSAPVDMEAAPVQLPLQDTAEAAEAPLQSALVVMVAVPPPPPLQDTEEV